MKEKNHSSLLVNEFVINRYKKETILNTYKKLILIIYDWMIQTKRLGAP